MDSDGALKLVFLGTNGWYATPLANTVCALIETPSRYIVLDAGDGIHRLDQYATDPDKPVDLFLSHFHLDHTIGLHIQPKFHFKNVMRIFGMPGTKKTLATLVDHPFTAPYSLLEPRGLKVEIHELKEGENKIDEYAVRAAPLVHADPCWGYRFEIPREKNASSGGERAGPTPATNANPQAIASPPSHVRGNDLAILSYCTDTGPCDNLVSLSRNADALITECGLLPGMPIAPSWPHLNPETAAALAHAAQCKRMFLTHFAAHLYDTMGKRKEAEAKAREIFPSSFATYDEMEVKI